MKISERVDNIEEKLNYMDKKVLVIIIVLIIFILPLMGSTGAISGLLVGFATLGVSDMQLDPIMIFAIVAGAGSFLRIYLGYLKAKDKHSATFDYQMPLISTNLSLRLLLQPKFVLQRIYSYRSKKHH